MPRPDPERRPAGPHPVAASPEGPLISIVVTNYNYGLFLGDAIRSCLRQTWERVECIVVDDGSTDESREIIAGFPEVRAVLKENGGQASAARAGAEIARGDVLMFLDSDDFLLPGACARVAEHWKPSVAAVFFGLEIQRDGRPTGDTYPTQAFLPGGHLAYVRRYGYLPASPTSGNAFATSFVGTLFREAVHMDGNCFDAYLQYSAPLAGDIVTIPERLGIYRIHDRNISLVNSTEASRVRAHIYYQYWAQQTLERMLAAHGMKAHGHRLIKGPYHLRWYLMTRDLPAARFALPPMSRLGSVLSGCWQSAVWPGMTVGARLRNVAVILLLGILPRPLRLRLSTRLGR